MSKKIMYSKEHKEWRWVETEIVKSIGGGEQEVVIKYEKLDRIFNTENPDFKTKMEDFIYLVCGVENVLNCIMIDDIIDFYSAEELLKYINKEKIIKYLKTDL